jgi:hypothetical protein
MRSGSCAGRIDALEDLLKFATCFFFPALHGRSRNSMIAQPGYLVHPSHDDDTWLLKEAFCDGEIGSYATRDEAVAEAKRLATLETEK